MGNGQLFGTLSFGSRKRAFLDAQTIDLLRTVCDLIAIAFERSERERASLNGRPSKWVEAQQIQ